MSAPDFPVLSEVPKMKTARFTDVVEKCGTPESYTLWVAPKDDAEFQRALKTNRVMTVRQQTVGSKKDFGLVGFGGDASGEFLVFPKSLRAFADRRIIGINYQLLKRPALAPPRTLESAPRPKSKSKPAPLPAAFHTLAPQKAIPARRAAIKPTRATPGADEKKSPAKAAVVPKPEKPEAKPHSSGALVEAVRAALKDLEEGKAVAAYQRLERALAAEVPD